MLDLNRLRLLLELQRRGTITAVAQALSYSPSTISQQLATLERETGVRLLEPVGRRVRLTPQAELLAQHAAGLLEQVERAEAALAGAHDEIVGTLRVAAFQTAVLTLVPPAITQLTEWHPRLRVEVTELEPEVALPGLLTGTFDLVIAEEYPGHQLPRSSETVHLVLVLDVLQLVAPASWSVRRLEDLADHPFVMESVGSTARSWANAACREAGFEPDVRYSSSDLLVHLRMVEEGLAAALLPVLAGAEERQGVRVHPLDNSPERKIVTAVRRGALQHPKTRTFTEALRSGTPAD
jgi:DNA-binding transcriptional LysR family regulator